MNDINEPRSAFSKGSKHRPHDRQKKGDSHDRIFGGRPLNGGNCAHAWGSMDSFSEFLQCAGCGRVKRAQ